MNVSVVTTLVTPPSSHVPILMVHTDAWVTKGTKETVWSVETSMNAPTILAMPMLTALTMLARLSAQNTNASYECVCFTDFKECPEGTCHDVDECEEITYNLMSIQKELNSNRG